MAHYGRFPWPEVAREAIAARREINYLRHSYIDNKLFIESSRHSDAFSYMNNVPSATKIILNSHFF